MTEKLESIDIIIGDVACAVVTEFCHGLIDLYRFVMSTPTRRSTRKRERTVELQPHIEAGLKDLFAGNEQTIRDKFEDADKDNAAQLVDRIKTVMGYVLLPSGFILSPALPCLPTFPSSFFLSPSP